MLSIYGSFAPAIITRQAVPHWFDSASLSHVRLKQKQRELRERFSTELTFRVHRGLSWYGRACEEEGDADVRYILLWIAFNAAYASEIDADMQGDRESFRLFFRTLVDLDPKMTNISSSAATCSSKA